MMIYGSLGVRDYVGDDTNILLWNGKERGMT